MKTLKELGIDCKGDFYGFDSIPLRKGSVLQLVTKGEDTKALTLYLSTLYKESDYDQIQKAINYTVVRFLKMDKNFANALDSLKRWKYVRDMMEEYNAEYPDKQFNVKSFNRLKEDIINELFK